MRIGSPDRPLLGGDGIGSAGMARGEAYPLLPTCEEEGAARTRLLTANVRHRLRPLRHDWSEALFEALVRQIVQHKLRWGTRVARLT